MKPRLFQVTDQIFLTLWVGGLWTVGYLVAPTLFRILDRQTAGNVAGQLFSSMNIIGLVCGSMLALGIFLRGNGWMRNKRLWAIVVMLVITIVGEFLLQPMMVELKKTGLVKGSAEAISFARLHGVSSGLFLVQSLLGLGLVVFRQGSSDLAG